MLVLRSVLVSSKLLLKRNRHTRSTHLCRRAEQLTQALLLRLLLLLCPASGGLSDMYEVKHLLGSGSAGDTWLCRCEQSILKLLFKAHWLREVFVCWSHSKAAAADWSMRFVAVCRQQQLSSALGFGLVVAFVLHGVLWVAPQL